MKKYLPWAAIVALLIGLALLPGPKAGASVVTPPTIVLTGVPTCDTTSATWTVTYTITVTNAPEGSATYFGIYPDGGAPNAGTLVGFPPPGIVGDGSATFTVVDIPATTTHFQIDLLSGNTVAGYADNFTTGPITGTCVTPPPPTTTTTVPPVVTPAAPPTVPPAPSVGLPPDGPVPVVTSAPLAFTGAPVGAEIGVALALIGLGALCIRRSRKVTAQRGVREMLGL